MRLEQMREIATELGTAELAPLAGASGAWIFTVPKTPLKEKNETAKRPAELLTFTTANLLEQGIEPTIMQEWEFTAINIACKFTYKLEAEATTSLVYTARLLIGGDIVWQQQQVTENLKFTNFVGNVNFTADFNTPLVLPRGRSLQLAISIVAGLASEEILIEIIKGTMSYYVRPLTGHRQL